jgi:hypothetical protein
MWIPAAYQRCAAAFSNHFWTLAHLGCVVLRVEERVAAHVALEFAGEVEGHWL